MGGTSTDVFLADTRTGAAAHQRVQSSPAYPSASPCSTSTPPAQAAAPSRASTRAACCASAQSPRAPTPAPSASAAAHSPPSPTPTSSSAASMPNSFLGGGVSLDRDRTERLMHEHKGPLATAVDFAAGILRVVESHMEKAIRVISVERGHDPRECTLVAFGGGGPLHACALARALRIPRVLVPAMPGALSAVGILLADAVRDYSRTVMLPGDATQHHRSRIRRTGTPRPHRLCRRRSARQCTPHPRHPLPPPGLRTQRAV